MESRATIAPASIGTSQEDQLFRKIALRILPVLMLGYLAASIDRVNVGFAKLHMAQALGLSDAMYGFGAGIFFLGYFLFEVPSNLILHRVGARRWLARIMISWGLVSGLTMFVRTPAEFYAVRFLLGIAEAGFIPGVIYYLTQWFPSQRRGRVMGVFYVALALAGLIGGPVSGWILETMRGVGNLAAWQWMFVIEALPTLVVAWLILVTLDDQIADADWLDATERALLGRLLSEEAQQKAHLSLRDMGVKRHLMAMCLIFFADIFAIYGLGFWMPTLIKNMGVASDLSIGMLSALPSLCAIPAMLCFGRSADQRRERRWHLATLYLLGALGLSLTVVGQHSVTLGIVGLCIANFGILAIPALFWALPTAVLGGAAAATGIALINCLANLSGFLGPYIVGFVKQWSGGSEASIWLMASVLVVGAMLVLSIPARLVNR
ncbi:MFS transporter [Paraburkholderia sp. CNPSo 3157]|uniref:MFS transporter n=1 Tax=Paraburkholderia franconis TaxID=2654983 RepID=A0A7X1NL99_9BURK|nr:MFS transporter [Paraburkholderia franconis]MPW23947.1 MFS transporter [Paraburkholderia franconis]